MQRKPIKQLARVTVQQVSYHCIHSARKEQQHSEEMTLFFINSPHFT